MSIAITNELLCRECGWLGKMNEVMKAPNPFDNGTITACPECRTIEDLAVVCDIPDCNKEATCGTPTDNGYKRCCGEHYIGLTA